ncbi:Bug family tripartite tricarboxylate transporter substrate binding protein [Parapusillimonas sp. JC17]|uniref:Bug family tripartite tricarboxylate transporter substrate binding protein n=1 Tax=Parapusillimonas sp. JC17 TaxID=3445768 RepID=UPI003F9ED356
MPYPIDCRKNKKSFAQLGQILIAAMALSVSIPAWAKFPERPIELVAGSPPGGSTDFVARVMAEGMSKVLDQPVVVVNQGGAGGNIATRALTKAKSDGYTLMVGGNFSHGINPALYNDKTYDPIKDFTAIARIANIPSVIAANKQTGINTLAELIERARKDPGALNYATGGNGTPAHISAETFKRAAGIDITHVPFRGGSPAVVAVMGGDVELIVGTPPVVMPQVANGKLTALAVTWPDRYSVMPDVPGMAEPGLPNLGVQGWFGIWGPAGIPEDTQQTLFSAIGKVLSDPETIKKLEGQGLIVEAAPSLQAFRDFVEKEVPIWKQYVIDSGASVN